MTGFYGALLAIGALAFLFPYAIYPFLLLLRPRRFAVGQAPPPAAWPSVSAIVAVFNGAGRIGAKIAELRRLDYPGRVEVIVADDGSDDGTAAAAEAAGADRVVRLPERGGKSAAQNAGVAAAAGEVLLFTDLAVIVQPDALRLLIAELSAPGVGCVTGVDRSVAAGPADPAQGAGWYTRFETGVRWREAETGTLLGVNGCLFVVRKEHRPPVPGACVDDLYVPLAVNDRGLRVTVHPAAEAIVPRTKSLREEFRRRARTFAGGLFTLHAAGRDLPRAVRRLRGRLWGHKRLRWLGPWLILLALYGSMGLALRWPPGWIFVIVEALAMGAALAGLVWTAGGGRPPRPLRLPAFLLLSQAALAWAWVRFALGRPYVVWRPTRREQA
jgi:cellulose synthase/poly-beta-1,6-N-acetylglucosamine synthase-like glycosyltransferase